MEEPACMQGLGFVCAVLQFYCGFCARSLLCQGCLGHGNWWVVLRLCMPAWWLCHRNEAKFVRATLASNLVWCKTCLSCSARILCAAATMVVCCGGADISCGDCQVAAQCTHTAVSVSGGCRALAALPWWGLVLQHCMARTCFDMRRLQSRLLSPLLPCR